jgi:hypothetical protein
MTVWQRTTTPERPPGSSADPASVPDVAIPALEVRDLVKLYRAGPGKLLLVVRRASGGRRH